jgi:hypothetical protein
MSNLVYPAGIRGMDIEVLKEWNFSTIVQSSPAEVTLRIAQMQNPIWNWTLIYNYLKNNPNDIPAGFIYTDLQQLMGFGLARQGAFDDFLFNDPDDNSVGPALATNTWKPLWNIPIGASILDSANHWQQVTAITTGITGAGPSAPTFNHAGGTTVDAGVTWTDRGLYTSAGYPNPAALLQVVTNAGVSYSPVQRYMGGQFFEDITDLNGSIAVYANGVLQSGSGVNYTLLGPGLTLPGAAYQGLYLQWVGTPTQPITATFNFYFRVRFEMDKQDFEKFLALVWTVGGPDTKNGSGMIKLVSSRAGLV